MRIASVRHLVLILAVAGCDLYWGHGERPHALDDAAKGDAWADTTYDVPTDGSIPSNVRSGTRLKGEWEVYADGTRQSLQTIRDSSLGVDCMIMPDPNGNPICLPGWTLISYADASCSQAAMLSNEQPSASLYAGVYAPSTLPLECPSVWKLPSSLYQRGAPLGLTQFWVSNPDGSCTGPSTIDGYSLYTLGASVPLNTFARLTVGSPIGAGAFPMEYITSADGFSAPWRFYDVANNFECYLAETGYPTSGATTATCAPAAGGPGRAIAFANSSCQQPVVSALDGCPVSSVVQISGVCGDGDYYPVGAALGSAQLYQMASTCVSTQPMPNTTYYQLGSAFTLGQLPRSVNSIAGHRMANIVVDDLPVTYPSILYDGTLGIECSTLVGSDGVTRCLPTTNAQVDTRVWYSDAKCQNQVHVIFSEQASSACAIPPQPYYALLWNEGNGAGVHLVGSRYTGRLYYGDATSCSEDIDDSTLYFNDGAAVPIASFAPATLVIDP
jgi:hypothetical protein